MTEPEIDQVDTATINDHIREMVHDEEIEADPDCALCALAYQLGVWGKWNINPDAYNRTDIKFADRWPPEEPPECLPGEHEFVCGCGDLMEGHSMMDNHAPTTIGCTACHRLPQDLPNYGDPLL